MRIFYKRQGQPLSKYDINETDTIARLKELMRQKDGFDPSKMFLVFFGMPVDENYDNRPLNCLGFKQGSIFYSVPKYLGG
jgi:hypothetical protein